jgi:hypothetical protein
MYCIFELPQFSSYKTVTTKLTTALELWNAKLGASGSVANWGNQATHLKSYYFLLLANDGKYDTRDYWQVIERYMQAFN